MTPLLLDIAALAVLVVSVLHGYKKGLILTAAGLVITIAAALGAWSLAGSFSGTVAGMLRPGMEKVIHAALEEAALVQNVLPDMSDAGKQASDAAKDAIDRLGLSSVSDSVLEPVMNKVREQGLTIRDSLTETILHGVSFALVFFIGFLVITLLLHIAAHIISGFFKLPVLNLANRLGGAALGLLMGALILFAAVWALRFTGPYISNETIQATTLLRFFPDIGLLDGMTRSLIAKLN